MNRREAIKYSLRILRRKNTIISGVFLMLAFYWFYCSCTTGYELYTEMSESVEIQCSIPENSLEILKKAEEVSAVTEYKESIQVIEYQGYTAQVTLKGMEEVYIYHAYAQVLQAPFTDSMPCLIADASVFGAMENEKKEKMKDSWEDMIFQTVFVSGHEARIYGVSQENSEVNKENKLKDQESLYILTTLEGYEALTAELIEEEGELKASEIKNYYVEVKDGYRWNKLENKLADWGITVVYGNSGEKNTHKWEEKEEKIRHQVIMCLMSFICGSMLIFYQGCLWKQEYEAFVRYIYQIDKTGKSFRRVYRGRIVLYIIMGMLGGFFMFAARIWFW